ncbi:hypothetical protein LUU34_01075900 [Aix galericulata]|nr:hypothetical protein LUU34_01075900 [Aix galericulata]
MNTRMQLRARCVSSARYSHTAPRPGAEGPTERRGGGRGSALRSLGRREELGSSSLGPAPPPPLGVRPPPAPLSPGSPQRCSPPASPHGPAPLRPARLPRRRRRRRSGPGGSSRRCAAARPPLQRSPAAAAGSGQGRAGPRHGARLSGEAAAAAPGPGMGGTEEAARRRRRGR